MTSKHKIFRLSFFILFICIITSANCQNNIVDSLKSVLKNLPEGNKYDKDRCRTLARLSELAPDNEWPEFNKQLSELCEHKLKSLMPKDPDYIFYGTKSGEALINMGYLAGMKGNVDTALLYFEKSAQICEKVDYKIGLASSIQNTALLHLRQGDINKALDYSFKSLKIQESIRDTSGMVHSLLNLGTLYKNQGENTKALEYFSRALEYSRKSNNYEGLGFGLNNVGSIYQVKKNYSKALEYYHESVIVNEKYQNKDALAVSLINLGSIYKDQGETDKALACFLKSLKLYEEVGDNEGIVYSLFDIGRMYLKQKKYNQVKDCAIRALRLSKSIGIPDNVRISAKLMSDVSKVTGDHKAALEYFELYIQMRDSINNQVTRKATIKSQLKYEYEKQAAADSVAHAKESEIKNAEIAKQTAEINAKKNQQYALFGGLGLVMIFAGFMFNRFKVTQKQKTIIEEQKHFVEEQKNLVEEKQKEILDSIHYAKRIQRAHLPNENYILRSISRLKKH